MRKTLSLLAALAAVKMAGHWLAAALLALALFMLVLPEKKQAAPVFPTPAFLAVGAALGLALAVVLALV